MQQQNDDRYTFEELQTYLCSYANLFQQDRVQDGIHLYSKNAKKVYEEMLKVDGKIKEKQEKYNKKINEKRAKMAEAIQAYAQKHRDDKGFNENMLSDPDIKHYRDEMAELEKNLNNAVKIEQDKFMQWEYKEMKGRNVILRNNNYISAAGKSKAIKKGLIGSNEIASFGNIDMKNSKNETLSGNLADIVHSVTHLLHQKAQAEKDEAKKSDIEKVIQMIIDSVKDFFGIQTNDKKQLEKQSKDLNNAITMVIKEYLDDSFKQVQKNLEAIQKKDEQVKNNYQSETEDTSLSSNTSAKDDAVSSQISQILNNKNDKNKQQANINEQNNNNKNINTAKLLDKKKNDNQKDIKQNNNIKNAIQNKNKEIQGPEIEIPIEKREKQAKDFIEKESVIESKNDQLPSKNNQLIKENLEMNEKDNADNITISNEDDDITYGFSDDDMGEKINKINSVDMYVFNNKKSALNDKSNDKSKKFNLSINKHNNATFKVPTANNGKKTESDVQISG